MGYFPVLSVKILNQKLTSSLPTLIHVEHLRHKPLVKDLIFLDSSHSTNLYAAASSIACEMQNVCAWVTLCNMCQRGCSSRLRIESDPTKTNQEVAPNSGQRQKLALCHEIVIAVTVSLLTESDDLSDFHCCFAAPLLVVLGLQLHCNMSFARSGSARQERGKNTAENWIVLWELLWNVQAAYAHLPYFFSAPEVFRGGCNPA